MDQTAHIIDSKSGGDAPRPAVSLVVPAYNEAPTIAAFYEATCSAFEEYGGDCQIVFVDDGSVDGTYKELAALVEKAGSPCQVTVISLSRNFGKEAALYAGLEHARGEIVGFIDADLQQRPETFREMCELLIANPEYDCVAAYQKKRRGGLRSWASRRFYGVFSKSSHMDVVEDASDFRVFRRGVAEALLSMPEYHRFSKGLFAWIGFKTLPFPYEPDERSAGKTNWPLTKLARYAIGGVMSFTTLPLKVAIVLGGIASTAAVIYLIVVIVQRLACGIDVPGYATIVVLILFFGGLQLLVLGVIGSYLARAYIQGKNRPIYITRRIIESESKTPVKAGKEAGKPGDSIPD